MVRYSLDTNALTAILRGHEEVVRRFGLALVAGHEFLICPVVHYELRRGLLHKDERKEMGKLDRLVARFRWQEFEAGVWAKAAQKWAEVRRNGNTLQDADLLIAAHALHFSAILVTADQDFTYFPGLQIENWAAVGAGA